MMKPRYKTSYIDSSSSGEDFDDPQKIFRSSGSTGSKKLFSPYKSSSSSSHVSGKVLCRTKKKRNKGTGPLQRGALGNKNNNKQSTKSSSSCEETVKVQSSAPRYNSISSQSPRNCNVPTVGKCANRHRYLSLNSTLKYLSPGQCNSRSLSHHRTSHSSQKQSLDSSLRFPSDIFDTESSFPETENAEAECVSQKSNICSKKARVEGSKHSKQSSPVRRRARLEQDKLRFTNDTCVSTEDSLPDFPSLDALMRRGKTDDQTINDCLSNCQSDKKVVVASLASREPEIRTPVVKVVLCRVDDTRFLLNEDLRWKDRLAVSDFHKRSTEEQMHQVETTPGVNDNSPKLKHCSPRQPGCLDCFSNLEDFILPHTSDGSLSPLHPQKRKYHQSQKLLRNNIIDDSTSSDDGEFAYCDRKVLKPDWGIAADEHVKEDITHVNSSVKNASDKSVTHPNFFGERSSTGSDRTKVACDRNIENSVSVLPADEYNSENIKEVLRNMKNEEGDKQINHIDKVLNTAEYSDDSEKMKHPNLLVERLSTSSNRAKVHSCDRNTDNRDSVQTAEVYDSDNRNGVLKNIKNEEGDKHVKQQNLKRLEHRLGDSDKEQIIKDVQELERYTKIPFSEIKKAVMNESRLRIQPTVESSLGVHAALSVFTHFNNKQKPSPTETVNEGKEPSRNLQDAALEPNSEPLTRELKASIMKIEDVAQEKPAVVNDVFSFSQDDEVILISSDDEEGILLDRLEDLSCGRDTDSLPPSRNHGDGVTTTSSGRVQLGCCGEGNESDGSVISVDSGRSESYVEESQGFVLGVDSDTDGEQKRYISGDFTDGVVHSQRKEVIDLPGLPYEEELNVGPAFHEHEEPVCQRVSDQCDDEVDNSCTDGSNIRYVGRMKNTGVRRKVRIDSTSSSDSMIIFRDGPDVDLEASLRKTVGCFPFEKRRVDASECKSSDDDLQENPMLIEQEKISDRKLENVKVKVIVPVLPPSWLNCIDKRGCINLHDMDGKVEGQFQEDHQAGFESDSTTNEEITEDNRRMHHIISSPNTGANLCEIVAKVRKNNVQATSQLIPSRPRESKLHALGRSLQKSKRNCESAESVSVPSNLAETRRDEPKKSCDDTEMNKGCRRRHQRKEKCGRTFREKLTAHIQASRIPVQMLARKVNPTAALCQQQERGAGHNEVSLPSHVRATCSGREDLMRNRLRFSTGHRPLPSKAKQRFKSRNDDFLQSLQADTLATDFPADASSATS
ncbi:PREDICTED: uncharacterized protein LOC106814418 [Priapulus caudatus]|uniref:Uncharacterized protein LOC106814418 n=1 Tax=Priapulus caudatus TaxID=37621 RepID=A0ABM1EPU7_PRICU|nr:PREDICTED: uncharacterized protein LOC106814418 [Priapulus caudatus]